MPDIDQKIDEANSKLRAANTKVTIERRGSKLWLRATLPPKPHTNKQQSYQQKVSLGLNATPAGLQASVIKAKQMGLELESGKFSWSNWIETPEEAQLISEWLKRFQEDHWQKTKKTDAAQTTWKDYQSIFNKLDGERSLTLHVLIEVVYKTEPNSRSRKKACTYLYKLGKFAALDGVEVIKELDQVAHEIAI
ncbi:hypothetical protein H6G76_02035 [Nostoc sp. FACHB-152]|uniref:hypothetical protein n=1 Tax=unclassified Nostoc TaxID=2593658 RepID=UPI001685CF3D|nr:MULTISPECIES: hypothetical protein [unclassified Nostoc]MBD2445952.1 hypothetical protein [Nostoc sp. FACHB-152]MBD2467872.1 hypothetical protein [Nostoc sp. FACHB-145]